MTPRGARRARPWAVLAGGGTAGHVTPAIAIARALVDAGHPADSIRFVGSARGIERRLVPEAGFAITLLPGRGIQRRFAIANVAAIGGLVVAFVRAFGLLVRSRPAVVVSVGGYASAACTFGAVALRIPLVLAEQNAHPGAAHRVVARFARRAAVTFPETPLPRAVVTGNPVRPEILAVDRERDRNAARDVLGLPHDRWVVATMGGSLGARTINEAAAGAVEGWCDRSDIAVRQLVGDRDWEAVAARPAPDGPVLWQRVRFEERMDLLYAAADVIVSRAGSSSISEVLAVGLPAVLVPYPAATDDHQTANARAAADAGAAVLVPDHELTADRLTAEVDALLADPHRLDEMARAARALARPDAAVRVAALVEEAVDG